MKVEIKGQIKEVSCGDKVLLTDGTIGLVTMDMNKAVIVKDDIGEFRVVEPKDIVRIVVEIIAKTGLVERLVSWIVGFLRNDKRKIPTE